MQQAGTIVTPSPRMRLSGYLGMAESGQRGPDGLESVADVQHPQRDVKREEGGRGERHACGRAGGGSVAVASFRKEAEDDRNQVFFFFFLLLNFGLSLFVFLYLDNLFPDPAGLVTVAQHPQPWTWWHLSDSASGKYMSRFAVRKVRIIAGSTTLTDSHRDIWNVTMRLPLVPLLERRTHCILPGLNCDSHQTAKSWLLRRRRRRRRRDAKK